MPEFTPPKPPTPPETSFIVKAADFIAALKGEITPQTTSLFVTTGEKLRSRSEFVDFWFIDTKTEYLVLFEAKIEGAEILEIIHKELTNCKKSILLYKCILPRINLEKTITKGWILINTFCHGIYIGESQSGIIRIDNSSHSGFIRFGNNSQSGFIRIDNNSQSGDIRIDNNSQSGDIRIGNNSQSGDIRINNESQVGKITINKKSKGGDININLNSLSGEIWINRDSQCGDIQVSDNSQCGKISLNNNSQCQDIIINKSQTGHIRIRESQCTTLQMDSNYAGIELYNATIPQMRISNCFLPTVSWQAGTKGELYISDCRINHLALNHTALLKDALFSVVNSKIYIAEMNKLAVQGQLIFTKTQPLDKPFIWKREIKIKPESDTAAPVKRIYTAREASLDEQEKEYNEHVKGLEEKFKRLNEKSNLYENKALWIIANSSLGKTEITGSNLMDFRFEYRDSKILDMFISGTKLPLGKIEIYKTNQTTKEDDIDFFEQQVSVYSQLKKIFDSQGNIVESTTCHSKAMEKQQKLLEKLQQQNKKGWFSDEGFDLFNFKLNKWSNKHGESWRRALVFVLITSFLVYISYYISLYHHESFSFDATGRFVGHFFPFLNIARKEDFMPGADHSKGLSLFLSFFGRIVTGFGIYQLIAAFRRHGRK